MSKSYLALIVSLAAAGVTTAASADVHPLSAPSLNALSGALAPNAAARPAAKSGTHTGGCLSSFAEPVVGDLGQGCLTSGAAPVASTASVANTPLAEVRDLPPLPGSAALFLSAVLSMGGWHLVRSALHLHWGALPEWYHAGGPLQIGHAVRFDLDYHPAPPCWLDFVDDGGSGNRAFLYRVPREHTPRNDAQSSRGITAPRGPPTPR